LRDPNKKQSNGGNYTVGYGGELERWNWMGITPAVTVNGVDDGLAWSLTSWGTPKLASGQNSGKKHVVLGIPIFAK
jgi:hypothetical protein